jgi:hypothetical protein
LVLTVELAENDGVAIDASAEGESTQVVVELANGRHGSWTVGGPEESLIAINHKVIISLAPDDVVLLTGTGEATNVTMALLES